MDLNEAYSMMSPSEPSRGASARMVHEETERLRVSAPPTIPLPPAHQPASAQPAKPVAAASGDRHKEAKKIAVYALIVALGLALHHTALEWLTGYISKAYLSDNWEQIAKLCYPAMIAACIWIIRTHK